MSQSFQSENTNYHFLNGGGEMGALMRGTDWSKTSILGSPENWPQSLKTTLSIILNSKFPMFLFWGPELICFYNDAFRPSLGETGKHPSLLGSAAANSWQEVWTYIKPIIDNIMAGGDATWNQDQLVPIYRNGSIEQVYWTFSHSAVRDESDNIAGVFLTCFETTAKVIADQDLKTSTAELEASESRFRSLIEQSPVAIAVFKSRDLYIETVNAHMLKIWGKSTAITGKTLVEAMPELKGQPFIPIIEKVFDTGEPFYGYETKAFVVHDGQITQGFYNFICQPIKDQKDNIVSVLQVVTDVTQQVNARLEVQKTEEMMRFAIDAAKLGSWHINPKTKELKYNATLAKIFGYQGEEPMTYNQAIAQVTDDYRPKILAAIEKATITGGDYDITYTQRRFDDQELIWLRSLGKLSLDEEGKFNVFSGFVMDITEQKQDEERKNDFIGMVSHELKTPLTSLNGYIQMLKRKTQQNRDTFTTNALETAGKQVQKMTAMINGFLNISRLESGKIVLHKTNFDIQQLVATTIEESCQLDSGHQITFLAGEPAIVYADQDKIANVISNFLSNAIKYSPKQKEVEVSCQVNESEITISVKDQGMGIQTEDIEKLFERYYRVENNNTISGFGIGLYLSAEIIERHKGKTWVQSEIGKGSTFYFSIPIIGEAEHK